MAHAQVAEPKTGRKPLTELQQSERRFDELIANRQKMMQDWRDVATYTDPFSLDGLSGQPYTGNPRTGKIFDSTAGQAVNTMRAGMLAGMASPSKPWLAVTTEDRRLAEDESVSRWLDEYTEIVLDTLGQSNFYDSLEVGFGDEALYATMAMSMMDHPEKILHCEALGIGTYVLAQDARGTPDTWGREFEMTVAQAVTEFGKDKLSKEAQEAAEDDRLQTTIKIRHLIEPNVEFRDGMVGPRGMRWRERYWESGGGTTDKTGQIKVTWGASDWPGDTEQEYLKTGGYNEFPIAVSRWDRHGADVWGARCPGFTTHGANKQLQAMQKSGLNALAKMVTPPTVGPPELEARDVSTMAGEHTAVFEQGAAALRALYQVSVNLQHLREWLTETQREIKQGFFEHVFLAVLTDPRNERPTATEVNKIDREILAILGPILERHNPMFDAVVNRVSNMLVRRSKPFWDVGEDGILPLPPAALAGADTQLRVRYVSDVALAQKRVGLANMEQFASVTLNMAGAVPAIGDNVDWDEWEQVYADRHGLPAKLTRSPEMVEAIRDARAKAQQAQQLAAAAPGLAGAAKDLSQTEVGGESALDRLTGAVPQT